MQYEEHSVNGLIYRTATNLHTPHAFTTRFGGVSRGYFASLNLAESRGDEEARVSENFRRLGALFGTDENGFAFTNQVHRDGVRVMTARDRHVLFSRTPYEADAIVTAERGLPLVVFTADCVPLLLYDGENGVAAAVHCGWRSALMDIAGKTVRVMESLGARAGCIRAATGAAIGAECFETGEDVPDAARELLGAGAESFIRRYPGREGKFLVDLQGIVRETLVRASVPEEGIILSNECTICECQKYWSHRATKGKRGSQAGVIMLR